jgi:glutamine synthetase
MPYQAEYIWLDGTKPTALLRNKTKIVADDVEPTVEGLPIWGFDGSSTNQAEGHASDCVLKPVFVCPDPIRGGKNILVLSEVLLPGDYSPHETNTRAPLVAVYEKYKDQKMIFGIEQEYTFLRTNGEPYGFPEDGSEPGEQGPYYCGVGIDRAIGRPIIEEHTQACLDAGLLIEGTNAEVMPGQWEFQIGAADPVTVSDHLWLGRWLLQLIAEKYDVVVSFAAKPKSGDWNGAGAHTNFSTQAMREGYDAIIAACEAIGKKVDEHVAGYGADIESRLTGKHETAPYNQFSYGVSNRGASIRIPWQVEKAGKGYAEDRRPNANSDPYTVTRLITDTVCSDAAGA